MPLGMEVGLGPGDIVLDGDPVPPSPKGGGAEPPSKFSAHVYCGQTAGWMKLVLGMEVHTYIREDLVDKIHRTRRVSTDHLHLP